MATYFNGNPEIHVGQDGGLQTMVLMNPTTYVQYGNSATDQNHLPPQPQPSNNLILFNTSSAAAATGNLLVSPHGPPQQLDNVSVLHGFIPRVHYNLYGTPAENPTHHGCDTPRAQQGLSLSLSSEWQQQRNTGLGSGGSVLSCPGHVANVVVSGLQGLVLSSKYLKAVQELLDEVVSVNDSRISNDKSGLSKKSDNNSNKMTGQFPAHGGGETGGKVAAEVTAAERQEIQRKKEKLINMLDEVDQRYRQYHQQMQIMISSFEQVSGIGSAKTYTSLALKTISKQFRSLKDTITAQIRAANKCLGEEDSKIVGGSSRLKFVDNHFRQQRALQQLGMIQHNNAWRPQRGLPERAVSVLRAWLFEHFLHPYPKDSDKIMLAKQAGLTRSQVSNWFINARVRLWKPMVEEMYLEEMKEQEKDNGMEEKTGKSEQQQNEDSVSKSIGYNNHQEKSSVPERNSLKSKQETFMNNRNIPSMSMPTSASTSPSGGSFRNPSGFPLMGSLELEGITQRSPKKPRNNELMQSPTSIPSVNMEVTKVSEAHNEQFSMKFRDERQYTFNQNNTNFIDGFGQYTIGETGRFEPEPFTPRYSGNGVSLTLGLPHCENFSVSATHQTFLPNQNITEPSEFGTINASTPHSSAAYDTISIQNQRTLVAQLLPDFVA